MPKGVATSEYEYLLKDKQFRRWYENVSRGSIVTAHTWLRRMGFIHKRFKKNPSQFAALRQKAATDFILDMVGELEKEGRSGSYVAGLVKPLKSWMDFNGKPIVQRIKIRGRNEPVRFGDERPPTPDELRRIFNAGDVRARATCAMVGFTGVRLEVLGSYLGTDGLKLKDFPELVLDKKSIEFKENPTTVIVRKSLSKTGNQFFTFLCSEGCDYLKQYLEWRGQKGEELTLNSPLITPLQRNLWGEHIRTINIGDLIRKPIREAGFQWRPYVLRRYFDTRLMIAESDGLIIRDYRTFWMGHSGDIEHTYTVNKGLSRDIIERMRDSYRKAAEKYLTTLGRKEATADEMTQKMNRQFLRMAGYSAEEVDAFGDLAQKSEQEIQELVQRRQMAALGLNGNGKQKIVKMDELRNYVLEGWEYVKDLNGSEAIIRLPPT